MVKSRFSSLDVRAMVNSVRPEILGCKVNNVYDISSRVYILKFARTNHKRFLVLESAVRFHLTEFERDKSAVPSNYTMKLRKHIRQKRCTSIQQLGTDRIIDITFGWGEQAFHLILELYVQGNIVLTDHEYNILTLLRRYNDEKGEQKMAVKEKYPMNKVTSLLAVPVDEFASALKKQLEAASQMQDKIENMDDADGSSKKKKKWLARKSGLNFSQALNKLVPWADPALCQQCMQAVLPGESRSSTVQDLAFDSAVDFLKAGAERALATLRSVSRPEDLGGGDLGAIHVAQDDAEDEAQEADTVEEVAEKLTEKASAEALPGWIMQKQVHVPPAEPHWAYEDFTPLRPITEFEEGALISFSTFHSCVDEFFAKVEEHKFEVNKAQHAKNIYSKVDKMRQSQGERVDQLLQEQDLAEHQADLIQLNLTLVERILAMLNAMIASQINWDELWREVKHQRKLGHPLAQHIQSLDLEKNHVSVVLGDDVDEGEDQPLEVVQLDLSLTAHANIAVLHSGRKEAKIKTEKTVKGAEMAIKQAQRKAQQDIQKFELKQSLKRVRQHWWFEKYLWFISSENYLVISGHDPQQNEFILNKYLTPKDVLVCSDIQGGGSVFIKNTQGGEVPPATLREAGAMALCYSVAWEKHILTSAWWVPIDHVYREPPAAGDYFCAAQFFATGRRNFLPPSRLEMGVVLLFHVADGCAEGHRSERRSRYAAVMESEQAKGDDGCSDSSEGHKDDDNVMEIEPVSEANRTSEAKELTCPSDGSEIQLRDGRAQMEIECSHQNAEDCMERAASDDNLEEEEDREVSVKDETLCEGVHDGNDNANEAEQNSADQEVEVELKDSEIGLRHKKGGLSKADKRRLKTKVGPDDDENFEFQPPERLDPAPSGETSAEIKKSKGPQPKSLPRGQKAKLKKIKDKYLDQDEEERELRLAVLGAKSCKWLPNQEEVPGQGDPEKSNMKKNAPVQTPEVSLAESGKGGKGGNNDVDEGKGKAAGKGDRSKKKSGQKAGDQKGSDDIGNDARLEEAANQLCKLHSLTGQPLPTDEVLYALTMCAPYTAVTGPYQFRVKLTPGSSKKSQVAKMCLQMFEAQCDNNDRKQLIRTIPENDTIESLCGSAKLSMPGIQKLQEKIRKDKQKESKEKKKEKQK